MTPTQKPPTPEEMQAAREAMRESVREMRESSCRCASGHHTCGLANPEEELVIALARCEELEDALARLRAIISNSRDAFLNPPSYKDPSLNAWRFEGLAGGCRIGLEVIDKALSPK